MGDPPPPKKGELHFEKPPPPSQFCRPQFGGEALLYGGGFVLGCAAMLGSSSLRYGLMRGGAKKGGGPRVGGGGSQ